MKLYSTVKKSISQKCALLSFTFFFCASLYAQSTDPLFPLPQNSETIPATQEEEHAAQKKAELDTYACAFTFPFMRDYELSAVTLNPAQQPEKSQNRCKEILLQEFGIDSKEDFASFCAEKDKNAQLSSIYNASVMLVKKYPKTWPLAIIKREALSAHEGALLFFAHAMSARFPLQSGAPYDAARTITLFRLALGSDFISEDEARFYIEPYVNEITQSVHSWNEYFSLYAFAESFLYTVNRSGKDSAFTLPEKLTNRKAARAKNAPSNAPKDGRTQDNTDTFIYESIVKRINESAEAAHDALELQTMPLSFAYSTENSLTIEDALYKPSEDALLWSKAHALYARRFTLTKEDLGQTEALCAAFPETPCIEFLRGMVYYNTHSYRKALRIFETVLSKIKSAPKTCSLYRETSFTGAASALLSTKPEAALSILNALSAETKKEETALYLSARTNVALIGTAADYAKDALYEQKAVEAFTALKKTGFVLPKADSDWLKKVDAP